MMEVYEIVLLCVSSGSVILVGTIFCVTLALSNKKVIRASSPSLLYVILFGCQLSFLESVIFACDVQSELTCVLALWCRHLGFTIVYGTILLKLWRVSVIMKSLRSRLFLIKDSQLLRKTGILVLVVSLYLVFWSYALLRHRSTEAQLPHCSFSLWHMAILLGELACLLLCGSYCCQTKKAPSIYNQSYSIGLAIWNETIWLIVYFLCRLALMYWPNRIVFQLLHIIRTFSTCLPTILLIFLPKLHSAVTQWKEMHGFVTDVSSNRRVHKLSVIVNKEGDLKTIHCVPCGPLYLQGMSVSSSRSSLSSHNALHQNSTSGVCEDEYTREEVDKLIEMLQQLKYENDQLRYGIVERHCVSSELLVDIEETDDENRRRSYSKAKSCVLNCDTVGHLEVNPFNRKNEALGTCEPRDWLSETDNDTSVSQNAAVLTGGARDSYSEMQGDFLYKTSTRRCLLEIGDNGDENTTLITPAVNSVTSMNSSRLPSVESKSIQQRTLPDSKLSAIKAFNISNLNNDSGLGASYGFASPLKKPLHYIECMNSSQEHDYGRYTSSATGAKITVLAGKSNTISTESNPKTIKRYELNI